MAGSRKTQSSQLLSKPSLEEQQSLDKVDSSSIVDLSLVELELHVLRKRNAQQIKQENETFRQWQEHAQQWHTLRIVMGYVSVVFLLGVAAVASWILLKSNEYPQDVRIAAGGALFVDVLGMLVAIWKVVFNPDIIKPLSPSTHVGPPRDKPQGGGNGGG